MDSESYPAFVSTRDRSRRDTKRMVELERIALLDTPAEERFDRFTRLARQVFDTHGAVISLVDRDRQWFKSRIGIDTCETPLGQSFCRFAVESDDVYIVEDATRHPTHCDNPLVSGEPFIRFYAGVALHGPSGTAIGSLAVIDQAPRTFDERALEILRDFGRLVEDELILSDTVDTLRYRMGALSNNNPAMPVASHVLVHEQIDQRLELARADGETLGIFHLQMTNLSELEVYRDPMTVRRTVADWLAALEATYPEITLVRRLSETEFVGVIDNGRDDERLSQICRAMRSASGQTSAEGGFPHLVTDCGASVFPTHGCSATELISKARLVQHPMDGERDVVLFDEHVGERILRDAALRDRFETALENGDLYFQWQPIYENTQLELIAFELLARWNDAEYGALSPATFIPMSDNHPRLRRALVLKALDVACEQIAIWTHTPRDTRIPSVSINIPGGEFYRPDFAEIVTAALEKHGVSGRQLVLELTESSLIADFDATALTMESIAPLGVRIAIDDFGSGYSSITYLTKLPLSFVKVDKSVVQQIEGCGTARRLFQGILELARGQGLATVAEGVETEAQLGIVRELPCQFTQGFLLGRPTHIQALDEIQTRLPIPEMAASMTPA